MSESQPSESEIKAPPSPPDSPVEEKNPRLFWGRALALLAVVAISVGIFFLPAEQIEKMEGWGYLGNFLVAILTNATVILPAPGILIVASLGAKLNPLLVGITAGIGATIGELSGYAAGFSGQAVIENSTMYKRLVEWVRKHGGVVIFILAAIPNPFFDLAGIAAGALRIPLKKFFFWVMLGKIVKMTLTAYIGAGLIALPGLAS